MQFSVKLIYCFFLVGLLPLGQGSELRKTWLDINEFRLQAEIAITAPERGLGLMHREVLAEDAAMLFVFQQPKQQCFWMSNTLIALTIAFLADDGTITQLEDMTPMSLESHCSEHSVRLALEVNQGWFAMRGLGVGDRFNPRAWAIWLRR